VNRVDATLTPVAGRTTKFALVKSLWFSELFLGILLSEFRVTVSFLLGSGFMNPPTSVFSNRERKSPQRLCSRSASWSPPNMSSNYLPSSRSSTSWIARNVISARLAGFMQEYWDSDLFGFGGGRICKGFPPLLRFCAERPDLRDIPFELWIVKTHLDMSIKQDFTRIFDTITSGKYTG